VAWEDEGRIFFLAEPRQGERYYTPVDQLRVPYVGSVDTGGIQIEFDEVDGCWPDHQVDSGGVGKVVVSGFCDGWTSRYVTVSIDVASGDVDMVADWTFPREVNYGTEPNPIRTAWVSAGGDGWLSFSSDGCSSVSLIEHGVLSRSLPVDAELGSPIRLDEDSEVDCWLGVDLGDLAAGPEGVVAFTGDSGLSGLEAASTEGSSFYIYDTREELVNEYEISGIEPVAVTYCRGTEKYLVSGYQEDKPGTWQIDQQSGEIQQLLWVAYSDMSCSPDGSKLAGLPDGRSQVDIVDMGRVG